MFQAEMHECELEILEIEPNGFGDGSSLHLSATIPRPFPKETNHFPTKMVQLWWDLRDFFQVDEWVGFNILIWQYFTYTVPVASARWLISSFPGFHIRCFHEFSTFPHQPVLEFGGSNHHHLWTYSIQSLALLWQNRQKLTLWKCAQYPVRRCLSNTFTNFLLFSRMHVEVRKQKWLICSCALQNLGQKREKDRQPFQEYPPGN